jgi:hypothetical protein
MMSGKATARLNRSLAGIRVALNDGDGGAKCKSPSPEMLR